MEVILGYMLASQPCLHAFGGFDIPTSSVILLEMFVIINNNFASFATRRFSTITTVFGHLEDVL